MAAIREIAWRCGQERKDGQSESSSGCRTLAHASQEMMPHAKPDSAPLTAPARVALFLQMQSPSNY